MAHRRAPSPEGRRALAALLAAAALLLVAWSVAVPIFEAPDEPAHWQYARHLHERKSLPRFEARFVEAHQPPLYYLLIAPFATSGSVPVAAAHLDVSGALVADFPPRLYRYAADDFARYWPLRIGRLVTCGMSVLTVYLAYLGGMAATGSPWTGILAGALTAFLPQFTFRGSNIGNDALVATSSAGAVYLLVRLLTEGFSPKLAAATAGAIAVAVLSKINAICLAVPFALAILSESGPWPRRIGRLAFLGVTAALVAPWFIRNFVLYGDPLGSAAMWQAVPDLVAPKSLTDAYFTSNFPSSMWRSFFGVFGWLNVPMPEWVYGCFAVLFLLGTGGAAWRVLRRVADRRRMIVLGALPVVAFLLVVHHNLTFSQPQGRFLFPALTTMALLVALGLEALPGWSPRATVALAIALAALNLYVVARTIVPAYEGTPQLEPSPDPGPSAWPRKRNLSVRHLLLYEKFRLPDPPTDVPATPGPLRTGASYAQSVVATQGNLTSVEVELAMYAAIIRGGVMRLHLRASLDGADDLATASIPLQTLYDHEFLGLRFPPIPDSRGKTYYLVFELPERSQLVTVLLRDGDPPPGEQFYVDGQPQSRSTRFRVSYATAE